MAEGADGGTQITTAEANEIVANMRELIGTGSTASPIYSERQQRRMDALRIAESLHPRTFDELTTFAVAIAAFIASADATDTDPGTWSRIADLFMDRRSKAGRSFEEPTPQQGRSPDAEPLSPAPSQICDQAPAPSGGGFV